MRSDLSWPQSRWSKRLGPNFTERQPSEGRAMSSGDEIDCAACDELVIWALTAGRYERRSGRARVALLDR